jgi:hypothetical protein
MCASDQDGLRAMTQTIPDEEAFEYTLQNFLWSLQVMTMGAVELCDAWGNYNVAWELVSDLKGDGDAIATMPPSYLDDGQKKAVRQFIDRLGAIPKTLLVAATSQLANQEAMRHPYWVPLRTAASELLAELEPVAARNRAYFASL